MHMALRVLQLPGESVCLLSLRPFAFLDYETETMDHTHPLSGILRGQGTLEGHRLPQGTGQGPARVARESQAHSTEQSSEDQAGCEGQTGDEKTSGGDHRPLHAGHDSRLVP
jgi:hypothetical protein